jgi:hypothetical protein
MDNITAFQQHDIPEVAQLFQKIMRQSSAPPPLSLQLYFEQIYLKNPWPDNSISSLVFRNNGNVAGFISVIPFPLLLHGIPIRGAIGGNFMVDPAVSNPLAGPRLLKMFLSGPQDLSYTDSANTQARKMWEGLGSQSIPLFSLQWLRVIRPAEFSIHMSTRHTPIAPFVIVTKPLTLLIDSILRTVTRSPFNCNRCELVPEDISPIDLYKAVGKFSSPYSLVPNYSELALAWLLEHAEEKKEYGPLRKVALYTRDHLLQGWFLYYPNKGSLGRVLQLGATSRTAGAVISHLISDARECGSLALIGRMEPRFITELSSHHCIFTHRGASLMVHTNNPEILNALNRGDAFFTRLEGDWWTRLQGDTFSDDN